MTGDPFAELEAVREEVLAEAERFVEELEPILGASLRSGFERLTIAQADHASRMDDPTRIALEAAVGRATEIGVAAALERLRPPEIWLAPLTAPEIAAYMGVSRQGAQKQLDRLLEEGLLQRAPNPQHARSPLYSLSQQGRSAYDRVDRRWNERAAALAAACKPTDVAAGHRALASLMAELARDLENP